MGCSRENVGEISHQKYCKCVELSVAICSFTHSYLRRLLDKYCLDLGLYTVKMYRYCQVPVSFQKSTVLYHLSVPLTVSLRYHTILLVLIPILCHFVLRGIHPY